MKRWLWIFLFFVAIVPAQGGELENLFSSIAHLNIQRGNYALCHPLTAQQRAYAEQHLEPVNSEKIYKFRDKDVNLVVDRASHRVLVIFEQFEQIDQIGIQNLVGDLFLAYDEPTVSAHDRVVYWAWGKKGKFTADQFNLAKEQKKPLAILATVKLTSDVKIMDKTAAGTRGNAYYIISSDPLLKYFQDK